MDKNTTSPLAFNTTVTTTTQRTVTSPLGEQTTLTTVVETHPDDHTAATYTKSETYGFYPGLKSEIPFIKVENNAKSQPSIVNEQVP